MAPTRLKKNINYIHVLSKANKKQRNAIISTSNKDLILCLCECALNVLNGNIPLTNSEFNKLKRNKCNLHSLVNPKLAFKDKRDLLLQKGGFLPVLLTPILTIAAQLLADSISKK